MPPVSIPLGPFELRRPMGRGGMAEIWEGCHRTQGVPVAVKVLTGRGARTPSFRAAFRNEARAVAGLEHPSIARVYDHGEIPEEVERLTGGRLSAGEPYLVMELAEGGALTPLCGRLAWPAARWILLCLLDALGHAHARGVVHRDLKPDNVLVAVPTAGGATSGRLRAGPSDAELLAGVLADAWREGHAEAEVRLSDFGLAIAFDHPALGRDGETIGTAGTPAFMAPEQIEGRWRDYGPWTDLYGLGCLGWALVTGAAPFGGYAIAELVEAHLRRPVPPLRAAAACAVPPGLDEWLGRLLAKEPADRFRWAADAALALRTLGEAGSSSSASLNASLRAFGPGSGPGGTGAGATVMLSRASVAMATWAELGDLGHTVEPDDAPRTSLWAPAVLPAPPLPESWRSGPSAELPSRLRGAGLGLFSLRTPAMVDRESERDLLWGALANVREDRQIRLVLLDGTLGSGKSRLARWLCERAHEVGAASTLAAMHSPSAGPSSGLSAMLARTLRCTGLPRVDVRTRLAALLGAQGVSETGEIDALCELVSPATAADRAAGARAIQFQSAAERGVVLRRFLARQSAERPVIAWLDDAHWSLETLTIVDQWLSDPGDTPLPLLVLLTVQDEELASLPEEAALLRQIRERPRVTPLRVGPLPVEHRLPLVSSLLGLEGELAAKVAERTGGNPLFAVQLVGDWVARGWLEPGPRGFALKEGVSPELPDNLRKTGEAQVSRLLEGHGPDEAIALELAAVLGQQVDAVEWASACALTGVRPAWALVDSMAGERLAEVELESGPSGGPPPRWSFVHAMLRESVLVRAEQGGRLQRHHHVCADVLESAQTQDPWRDVRLGRHALAAGEPERALAPLLRGVQACLLTGDLGLASALLHEREAALSSAEIPPTDHRWGEGWLAQGNLALQEGQSARALTWFQRAEAAARSGAWSQILAESLAAMARAQLDMGDAATVRIHLEEAHALAEQLQLPRLLAQCDGLLCRLYTRLGAIDTAFGCGLRALEAWQRLGDAQGAGYTLFWLGDCANWSGNAELAAIYAARSKASFDAAGFREGVAISANSQGEIARMRGRLEEALAHYRTALSVYRAIGSGKAIIPYLNIGLMLVESGELGRARPILELGLEVVTRQGLKIFVGAVHVALLAPAAAAGDWSAFDRHLNLAQTVLLETASVDVDNARMARIAGDRAAAASEFGRARAAWQLSLSQWEALGRENEAGAVRQILEALE